MFRPRSAFLLQPETDGRAFLVYIFLVASVAHTSLLCGPRHGSGHPERPFLTGRQGGPDSCLLRGALLVYLPLSGLAPCHPALKAFDAAVRFPAAFL